MRDNRESIDFVSLQANRRPRFRKDHGVIRKASELEHEAAADFPSLPIRPNPLRRVSTKQDVYPGGVMI